MTVNIDYLSFLCTHHLPIFTSYQKNTKDERHLQYELHKEILIYRLYFSIEYNLNGKRIQVVQMYINYVIENQHSEGVINHQNVIKSHLGAR